MAHVFPLLALYRRQVFFSLLAALEFAMRGNLLWTPVALVLSEVVARVRPTLNDRCTTALHNGPTPRTPSPSSPLPPCYAGHSYPPTCFRAAPP